MLFSVLREPVLSLPAATRSGFFAGFVVVFFELSSRRLLCRRLLALRLRSCSLRVRHCLYLANKKKYSIGISQQSQTNYSAVPEDLPTSQHKAAHQGRQLFGDDVILFELILHSVSVFNPHKRLPKSRSFCAYFSTFLSLNSNLVIWGYAVFVS